MPDMVTAYIRYCAEQEMPARPRADDDDSERPRVVEVYDIQVVDMFGEFMVCLSERRFGSLCFQTPRRWT